MNINRSVSKECLDNIIIKMFIEYYSQKAKGIEGILTTQLPTFLNKVEKEYIAHYVRKHIQAQELKGRKLHNA